MKRKILAACVLALGVLPLGAATPDLRPELDPVGLIERLGWTPGGALWFGTEAGQVYVSRDGGRGWAEVPVSPLRARHQKDYAAMVSGDILDTVEFFDDRHGLAVGYAHGRKQMGYRTADGGATWKAIPFQGNLLVKDLQVTPEGRAWIVGFSGEVLASEDYGATWRVLSRPSEEDTSFNSVQFTSPADGLVSADKLYRTVDGGKSWRQLPDPFAQGLSPGCDRDEVEKASRWADWIYVQQCGEWFRSRLVEDGTLAWQPLRTGGQRLLAFEPMGDRALAITETGEIVLLGRDLELAERPGFTLPSKPLDVAIQGGRIAILDSDFRVTVGENGSFARFAMVGQEGSGRPPNVFAFDRAADGTLWGLSPFFLYLSRDGGRTWERQADLPRTVEGFALRPTGEALLWSREGYTASYDPRTRSFATVPGLEKLDTIGLFRRGNLWLAYGGLQEETARRVEVLRAFTVDQFAGSAPFGFVAASTDSGGHWQVIDRWEGSGPQALFLSDDNTLTLLSWIGSVRRGKLSIDEEGRASAALSTVFQAGARSAPYVQTALWLDFLAGEEGWVRGWVDHVGNFLYKSTDGGKSWVHWGQPQQRSLSFLNRLGNGTWLAQELPPRGQDDHSIVRWESSDFRPEKRFAASIRKAWTDSTGGLLVTLENGEIWGLDASGTSWTRLR
jgi:photosystem II stability/assembly factor-like uncharacterized protein